MSKWSADDRTEEPDPADENSSDRWQEGEDPRERGLPWLPPDLMGRPESDQRDP